MEIEEISLFLQIFLLAFLVIGYFFFRIKDLKRHGQILTLATAIHIPTIILRMIPAFSSDPELTKLTFDPLDLIHWGHVALGLLAPVLGVYISFRWMMHRYDSQF